MQEPSKNTTQKAPRVGIVGGGQLGRMLIQSAANWNCQFFVLDPDPQAPAFALAHHHQVGALDDYDTLMTFGKQVDYLTIEIEKVNAQALADLKKAGKRVYPDPETIRIIQNKVGQKQFYQEHNIPTSAFISIDGQEDIAQHLDFLPAFQKLATGGYDGKGVQSLLSPADLAKAWDAPGLLEKSVDIAQEISIIVARDAQGNTQLFPAVEMVFDPDLNLLDYLLAPARISPEQEAEAARIATQLADALDLTGLLAIEMFVTQSGEVLVNESAPRPHNSGHHTIEASPCSQYEQLMRILLELPLGDTRLYEPAAIWNLIGEPGYKGAAQYEGWEKTLSIPGAKLHLYQKQVSKPGRKMGHVTLMDPNPQNLLTRIQTLKSTLKVRGKDKI